MLPIECQIALKNAAQEKDHELLDLVIAQVKSDAPSHFFWGSDDPNLEKRVFFHAPFSNRWSGKAIKYESILDYEKSNHGN
jgi:hypothetical protein